MLSVTELRAEYGSGLEEPSLEEPSHGGKPQKQNDVVHPYIKKAVKKKAWW